MLYPHIRLQGQEVTDKPIYFITIIRQFTGVDLAGAKQLVDDFRAAGQLEFPVASEEVARGLGAELLRWPFASRAWIIRSTDDVGAEIPAPPRHFHQGSSTSVPTAAPRLNFLMNAQNATG